jgi:pimeloyl-ACP methyl ester carboxylesterase
LAVDPPGYGSSALPRGTSPPTFDELRGWAESILATADGPWVLAGNSSGGVFATAAAVGGCAGVAGLLLVGWANWGIAEHPAFDVLCPVDRAGLEYLLSRTWHRPPPLRAAVTKSLLEQLGDPGYRRHVSSFDKNDFAARLERFRGPLAFIGGVSDGLVPPELIVASARSREGAESRVLDECGHYPHRERPVQFASVLEELVRWCLSAPA